MHGRSIVVEELDCFLRECQHLTRIRFPARHTAISHNPHLAVSSAMLCRRVDHDSGETGSVIIYVCDSVYRQDQHVVPVLPAYEHRVETYVYGIDSLDNARMAERARLADGILGDGDTRAVGGVIEGEDGASGAGILQDRFRQYLAANAVVEGLPLTRLVAEFKVQMELSTSMRSPTEYAARGPVAIADASLDLRKSIPAVSSKSPACSKVVGDPVRLIEGRQAMRRAEVPRCADPTRSAPNAALHFVRLATSPCLNPSLSNICASFYLDPPSPSLTRGNH